MINLLKNEITKVIKKKSSLIMVIVMFGYALLTNIIYLTLSNVDEVEFVQNVASTIDDDNLDPETKAYNEALKETYDLAQKYEKSSWQYNYVITYDYDNLETIHLYEASQLFDSKIYNEAKEKHEKIVSLLKEDDWKSVVKIEMDELKEAFEEGDYTKEEYDIKLECLKMRLDQNISYANSYQNDNLINYEESKISLLGYANVDKLDAGDKEFYQERRETYLTSEYALKHNLNITSEISLQSVLMNFFDEFMLMIIIMVFMIAGSIMSNEYNNGTIKLLLVRPYSRIKILLSKYITVLICILIAILIMVIAELLIGGVTLGFSSLSTPALYYNAKLDTLQTYNIFAYLGLNIIGKLPNLIILATLAFAISTIFSNTALAIIMGFVGQFVGSLFSTFATSDIWWIKYIISLNWDWTPYLFKSTPSIEGISFIFSFVICLIFLLAMIIPTFLIFKHKDIVNV